MHGELEKLCLRTNFALKFGGIGDQQDIPLLPKCFQGPVQGQKQDPASSLSVLEGSGKGNLSLQTSTKWTDSVCSLHSVPWVEGDFSHAVSSIGCHYDKKIWLSLTAPFKDLWLRLHMKGACVLDWYKNNGGTDCVLWKPEDLGWQYVLCFAWYGAI